jgi:hypothetical protein
MRVFIFLFSCLPILGFAQNNWLLGFDINPSWYSYQNIADDTVSDRNIVLVQQPDLAKMPRSWSVGGRAQYMFNRHVGFVTGLRYNWSRAEFKRDFFSSGEGHLTIDNHYLQIPVGLSITTDQRKDDIIYLNIGLAPSSHINYSRTYKSHLIGLGNTDWLINSSTQNNQRGQQIRETSIGGLVETTINEWEGTKYYNTFALFAFAELGLQRRFSDNSSFFFGFNSFVTVLDPEKKENWSTYVTDLGHSAPPRPRTTFIHIGIQVGWIFELDGRG